MFRFVPEDCQRLIPIKISDPQLLEKTKVRYLRKLQTFLPASIKIDIFMGTKLPICPESKALYLSEYGFTLHFINRGPQHIVSGNIRQQEVKPLFDFVEQHTFITSLLMRNGYIDDTGADFIASSLANDSKLEVLDIRDCFLTEEGCLSIIKALTSNYNLRVIMLSGNRITNRVLSELLNVLQFSATNLAHAELTRAPVSDEENLDEDLLEEINLKLDNNIHNESRLLRTRSI